MLASDFAGRVGCVQELAGRIHTAADLSELVRRKALPAASPSAFVLPLGLNSASTGDASAGAFTQLVDETFGVLIFVRAAGDLTGGKALPTIDQLVAKIIAQICGWSPDAAIGAFRLARGQLLSADEGFVLYQLDFSIRSQIRVMP